METSPENGTAAPDSGECAGMSGTPRKRRGAALLGNFSWTGLFGSLRLLISRQVWRSTLYLLVNYTLGVFWFVVLLTLMTLGVGLSYTLVGLGILALALRLWMAGAALERRRVGAFLGVRIVPLYRPLPERGLLERIRVRAADPAVWRDLLYLILLFPLGTVEGTLVLVAWGLQITSLAAVFYLPYYWVAASLAGAGLEAMLRYTIGTLPLVILILLAGLALAVVLPRAIVALAAAHAALAKLLLSSDNSGSGTERERQLAERVEDLRESRARLLEATLLERRRIERDLHDGVQQQLVAIAIDLGLARQKMQTDSAGATEVAALIEKAHEETKQSIRDLRNLARGLHPAVLSDRGLDAAISALAERCPVPVEVKVDLGQLDRRPSEAVESTAYFVAAEALTNIAKHSHAAHAWLNVSCARGVLTLEVGDDGIGAAAPARGSGLAGLADRVAALDGHLIVESPPGGPTRISAQLPCE